MPPRRRARRLLAHPASDAPRGGDARVAQRLAALHRPVRDLGHPIPPDPGGGARAPAAGAGLPAHGAGGAPARAPGAASRRAAATARALALGGRLHSGGDRRPLAAAVARRAAPLELPGGCLLYTSDAADDLLCVDLGGRRIIKKK